MLSNAANRILDEMMDGPEVTYVVLAITQGGFRFYTFSSEEAQTSYVEYLTANMAAKGIMRLYYGESDLDRTDADDSLFTVH